MLQRRDLIPHFEATTVDGDRFNYANVWQRRNLVLVTLPGLDSEARKNYTSDLSARIPQFRAHNTECVITAEQVPGVPQPAAVVADKWGEVIDIHVGHDVTDLPSPEELLDWIEYVETRCPECEGEVR